MKKLLIIFNVFLLLFCFSNIIALNVSNASELLNNCYDEIQINSRIAVVYNRENGQILWGKNESNRTAMASTTKIMTAIIVVENSNLDEIVDVSNKAANTGGSTIDLKKGHRVSVLDLLYGLMLESGNDAAVALAEYVGGSVEEFVVLMNNKAEELGLNDTHFVTPHGLDDPNHYTTAEELAKITDYALRNETIVKIVSSKNYTININGYQKALSNTNELLGNLEGIYGVKTGFTNNAGRCLVTATKKNDIDVITVVLQADTKKDRGEDSKKIIKYIFDNFTRVNIEEIVDDNFEKWCNINKGRININKAQNLNFKIGRHSLKNKYIVIRKSDIDKIKVEINAIFEFDAPIQKNTQIGQLKISVGEENVDNIDLFFDESIEKKSLLDFFKQCIISYK